MITVSLTSLLEVCEDESIDVRPDYSGRHMYGRRCVGVVGTTRDLMRFTLVCLAQVKVVEGVPTDVDDQPIAEEWLDVSWDQMGMSSIFYWTGVQVIDDTQAEDDKD